ncbi:protocadherin Fat 4-like isoform X2 [Ostrea edulis]|uniref:protocadherin Fat 4-like isoform X2 n=1 Tax=Ostrea edulis TaxID=37623 RepID=UPI002094A9E3|nr:protocadherin Fat 4-like isoform X2 [Ostrea edulis]
MTNRIIHVSAIFFLVLVDKVFPQVTPCAGGTVGVDPAAYSSRTSTYGANSAFLIEDPLYQITCCGAITSWEVSTSGSGRITLQIWRKLSSNVYQLLGQNVFTAGSGTFSPTDRIMVQHGDYIGWYSSGPSVRYDTGTAILNRVKATMTALQPGDLQDWSTESPEGVSRNYAIRATVSASSVPVFSGIPSLVTFPEETPQDTVVHSLTITDADATDVITLYTKSETSGYFTVDTTTFRIKTTQDRIPLGSNYIVEVKAIDSCYKEATATVTFSVSNTDITMSFSSTTSSVFENSTSEEWLSDVIVSDPMNDYTCFLQTTNVPFTVRQNNTGIQSFSLYLQKWPQLSASVTSSYTLTSQCTDGVNTKTAIHTVSVIPNTKPAITNLGGGVTVTLDARTVLIGHFVYNVSASDNEEDDITFSLICTPSGCPFTIYNSGAILLTSRLITHSQSSYTLTVSVSDSYTQTADSSSLSVSITNRNTNPTISIPRLTYVNENSPLGQSVLSLAVSDAESNQLSVHGIFTPANGMKYFDINPANGVVTTSTVHYIDYDILSTKDIVLVVCTSDGIAASSQTGTIRIVNINEPCYFTEDYYSIIREEGNSQSTFPLPEYNVIDPDNGETFTFQKTCGNPYDNKVSINTNTGQFSFLGDYDLDIPGTVTTFNCTLTVTDSGGNTDTTIVGVFVLYKNEFAPTFSVSSVTLTLQSHELIGSILTNFTAHDSDLSSHDDGKFYYSLDQSSNSGEYFGIMTNGSIYIKEDLSPLYLGRTLSLTLTAKDYGSPSRQSSVAITVQIPLSTTITNISPTERALQFENNTGNSVILALAAFLSVGMFSTIVYIIHKYTLRGKQICKTKNTQQLSTSRTPKLRNSRKKSINSNDIKDNRNVKTTEEDELQTETKQPMPSFETINSYETQTKFPINSDGIKDNQMEW